MLSQKQKRALEKMVDGFLFYASARGITDTDRIIRLMRETLPARTPKALEALEYAVKYVTTREVKHI